MKITLNYKAIAGGNKKTLIKKDKTFNFIYINTLNYQPSVSPLLQYDFYMQGVPGREVEVTITGNSGHPSEIQNFIFTKCAIANTSIANLVTPVNTPFAAGSSTIRIKLNAPGDTTLTVQINDGALENNISKEAVFPIRVHAGSAP